MKGNAENKSGLCSFLMLNKSVINQVFPSAAASKLRSTESEHVHFPYSPSLLHHVAVTESPDRWVGRRNRKTHTNHFRKPSYLPAIISLADRVPTLGELTSPLACISHLHIPELACPRQKSRIGFRNLKKKLTRDQ